MEQPKHILIVDDNDDVREVIGSMLQEHCYRVSSVCGGAAMRDFLEADDTVDCVVLDVLMPGEASAPLALHLKQKGVSVVVVSGSPEAMTYAEDNGLQLLQKPFRAQELCKAIETALGSGEPGQREI
jgi:two-component system, OmpR family, response regulator